MKNLKSRHIKEALYLLKVDYPISTREMSENIGVKIRTLKSDLKLISDFFSSRGVLLVRKPGIRVYVKAEKSSDREKLKEELIGLFKNTNPDKDERFKTMLLDCLSKNKIPTLEDWCFQFNASRPTILKDVSHVKNWLKNKQLSLKGKPGRGYILEGIEEDIRDAMVYLFFGDSEEVGENINKDSFDLKLKEKLFENISLKVLETFLNDIEKITKTTIVDRDFLALTIKLAITVIRVKNKHPVSMEPKKVFEIMQNPAYRVIFANINIIEESYKIKFPLEEIAYVTLSFIGSKIKDSFDSKSFPLIGDEKYSEFAERIARISEDIFGLPIAYDEEFIRMLSLHLKAVLTKIKYSIKVENSLVEKVKREYPLPFSIAKRVSLILGKEMHMEIPEEEAGYIAMYIAMASEKIRHEGIKRKKVAVVCSAAMGTSSLLFWRLLNEMPDIDVVQIGSYKDILEGKIEPGLNLIISTIPLPDIKIPYIVVSPFLNSDERKLIREKLGILKHKLQLPPSAYINDILDEELIFKDLTANKASDVIKLMGSALIKKRIVKDSFIDAVIEREKKFPTGLNTPIPIALPHADSSFTIKEGFSVAVLKQPVDFRDMGNSQNILKVKLVLMPVLLPNGIYDAVFYQLLEDMRNIKIARKILLSKDSKEAKEVIIKSFLS
jgi:activator of the mannose operon (transcriptional antiterminator)